MGRNRKSNKIRAYFVERGISIISIAREIGISDSLVHETINGRKENRRVLAALVEKGVPVEYLDLPDDIKSREAA